MNNGPDPIGGLPHGAGLLPPARDTPGFSPPKIKSPFIQSFLYYVPYAVLGAMTFPAILSATGNTVTALVSFSVALLLAFYEKGLMTVAICASLAVYLCQFFLG